MKSNENRNGQVKLSSQIGVLFFIVFLFAFLVAKLVARSGVNLGEYGDFALVALLIGFTVLVSLLIVQLTVVRPLEFLQKGLEKEVEEPSESSLPRFAAREIFELEKGLSERLAKDQVVFEAQRKAKESEILTKGIVDAALDAVVVINKEGKVTEWSRQSETLFGWSRDEAMGEEMSDMIIPESLRSAHHGGIDHYLATKEGPVINNRVEVPAVNRQGEEFPVELTVTPFELDGNPFFSAFVRDLREAKKAELELATEKERLSATLTGMEEGVVVSDQEGKILLINPAASKLLILPEGEHVGKDFSEIVKDNNFLKLWHAASQEGEILRRQTFIQSEVEGQIISANTSIISLGGEEEHQGVVTIFRDVTKEKEVDRMKSDFVSSVSHELRTPLTSIKGFTSTMLKKGDDIELGKRQEFLGIIFEETKRLEALIRDLLEISVLETGKVGLNIQTTSLSEVLSQVASIVSPMAEKKKVSFISRDETGLELELDKDKIHTAILNLASNAVKFTEEGDSVELSSVKEGGEVRISIKDSGLGIPKRDLENIFSRFFRVNRPGTEIPGTGLGLSIVKEIVELHEGRLEVDSEIGEGSEFKIFLPVQ